MDSNLPRRLSFEDAAFLYFETPSAPLHVGSLGVYEGTIPYETLVRHLESRIHTIPRYRQRVTFVPLNLGHPTWEDDPEFDIRRHVRRIRPRGRVDEARLAQIAADLFSPMMERHKPLWDITLIEGLTEGRSALLARAHHSMVDGVSGVELLVALLDMTPTPREVEPPPEEWVPRPTPVPADLMSDAFWDWLSQQVGFWGDVQLMAVDSKDTRRQVRTIARSLQKAARFLMKPAPATPFNAPIRTRRALAWTQMPFADVRAIRSALGGTVNDAVLAILAGGLARYLDSPSRDGALPELRVVIPVNVRRENQTGALGNRVSFMLAGLPLAVSKPIERLAIIQKQVRELKEAQQAEGMDTLAQLLGQLPPVVAAAIGSMPTFPNRVANLVCTNVPGPMVPLYCVGHRMLAHYPFAPIAWDMGVNVGVMSYDQHLFWGVAANAAAVPDPERLALNLDEAFVELRDAAGVTPSDLPTIGERTVSRAARPPAQAAAPVVNRRDGDQPAVATAIVVRGRRAARRR